MVDYGLPEFRLQEILIARFTGVDLYSNIAGQFLTKLLIQFQNFFCGNGFRKINNGFHNHSTFLFSDYTSFHPLMQYVFQNNGALITQSAV
jgi:hypothetical protein